MARYTNRLTSVRVEDADGLGITLTPTDGDFSGGAENDTNAEKLPVMNRGAHDGLVKGVDMTQELSITLQMRNEALTSLAEARVSDFFKKAGVFAAANSVDDDQWAFKCILTFDDGTTSTTKTYPKCTGTIALSEGLPANTFAIAMTNYLPPTDA